MEPAKEPSGKAPLKQPVNESLQEPLNDQVLVKECNLSYHKGDL